MSLHQINTQKCSFCGKEELEQDLFWCMSNVLSHTIVKRHDVTGVVTNLTGYGGSVARDANLSLHLNVKVKNDGSTFNKFCKQCYKILSDYVQENHL